MLRRLICLIVLLSAATPALLAQGAVRGVVMDSIRGAPLVGALVTIEGTALRVRTDERGVFSLRNVPAGEQRLIVQSPYLDSMALGPIVRSFEARRSSIEMTVSTMSLAAYQRAVCGQVLDAGQGILIGDATLTSGNPAAGQHVAAIWNETVISTAGTSGLVRGAIDTTNAVGFFALCGVPVDAEYQLRGGDDVLGTSVLTVTASAQNVRRRDIRVGRNFALVRVKGRVTNAAGAALEGDVELVGDSATVHTGTDGEFEITIPERSTQLWLRVIGYSPRYVNLEPSGEELELGDLVLDRIPVELGTRLIEGRVVTREEFEFEERRKGGAGVFLDSATLARNSTRSVNSIVATAGRFARVARAGRTTRLMLRRGVGMCPPRVFLDGTYMGKTAGGRSDSVLDAEMVEQFLREAKRIEMYTAQFAPAAYPDFDGCGVVLIWTR